MAFLALGCFASLAMTVCVFIKYRLFA